MKKKVVVVGGVAGGATFSSQLRMLDKDIEIIIVEKSGTMSFANCGMPYYLGGFIKEREKLIAATPESFQKDRNIEVRLSHEAISIDREEKTLLVLDHHNQRRYTEKYDLLVLSPGVSPVIPDIQGLSNANCYTLRAYEDMLRIDDDLTANKFKSVCIVGGGFIGVEMAENLKNRGLEVSLIQRSEHVLSVLDKDMSAIIEAELIAQGIHLHKDLTISRIDDNGRTLSLTDGSTIEADCLILSVGVAPNTKLAVHSNLAIGETTGIKVNEYMQTSDPSIYAVGDVIETTDLITGDPKRVPLAWVAHRQAYVAAKHITHSPVPFKGTLGTSICKVFTLDAASLGLNEAHLKEKEIEYETVIHESKQHAGYFPGASDLRLKVHFSPIDGKIFGGQAVGSDGVDKRMDILSTAISSGMTVLDLQEIEVAYAPPFSSPKDPINMIGYKAAKKMK
ncbi:CoA-disulfide reductase [Jeotgalibacillus proteolyticus]|uniref:CoA-disulfide reductase n=1 Tax=Jeotgalibacillus proteolyticus TaxID=2082395 RepID=A0A2S5GHL4_9BACL|nr:CoA-disulfide reductase [Jeotgalibacillus proteolyticus]PPA72353.1 CoA-disulfide reductase [Jeotgalibacillus proteolyticus]